MFYDLNTGESLAGVDTGAMCAKIQFSADGKYFIAFSGMAEQVTVGSMQNFATVMKIQVENVLEVYNDLVVGFNKDGTEAVVLYPDGHADVGLLYQDLDTLVEKAKGYTK